MTADQRAKLYQQAFADLTKATAGWVVLSDALHGDNYAEIAKDWMVEVSHRRWPGSKLPPLAPAALERLAGLGFRETERNLRQSYEGWSFSRMTRSLESVFLEVYGCPPDFDLALQKG